MTTRKKAPRLARAAMVDVYRRRIPGKIERLAIALRDLEHEPESARGAIRSMAHKLAGTGASFGMPEISEQGRRTELAADGDLGDEARRLVEVLRAALG